MVAQKPGKREGGEETGAKREISGIDGWNMGYDRVKVRRGGRNGMKDPEKGRKKGEEEG